MKNTTIHFLTLIILMLFGCSVTNPSRIERHPQPMSWFRGEIRILPTFNSSLMIPHQVDFRSADVSHIDMRNALNTLQFADFDSQTIWPHHQFIPLSYDPELIMELGKNPGLGIRQLQGTGITGDGVCIAIIDHTLLVDHTEIKNRIRVYEEIGIPADTPATMHGMAVASIAVGDSIGVAPRADLYYVAANNEDRNFTDYARAVLEIVSINKTLPVYNKIRVLSISSGWETTNPQNQQMVAAVNEAKDSGIFVISPNLEQMYGFKINCLGRDILSNPDDFNSYHPSIQFPDPNAPRLKGSLLIPSDYRTTASFTGITHYAFYAAGGWSWIIPYLAGLYALAVQVAPDITPDHFFYLCIITSQTLTISKDSKQETIGPVIDPVSLIEKISEEASTYKE